MLATLKQRTASELSGDPVSHGKIFDKGILVDLLDDFTSTLVTMSSSRSGIALSGQSFISVNVLLLDHTVRRIHAFKLRVSPICPALH